MNRCRRTNAGLIGLGMLATLAGCQNSAATRRDDPLLGTGIAATTPYPARPSVPAGPEGGTASVPPIPSAQASTSPAALAYGPGTAPSGQQASAPVTMEGPRPLSGTTASLSSTPTGVTPVGTTTPLGVPPSSGPINSGGIASYEQIQQALRARGVVWQQLNMTGKPDEWHFICAIPNPSDPYTRRNYEFSMVGGNGLNAMRAVLEQINQDRP